MTKKTRITINDGILQQGDLEFKVDKLTLDIKGRIVRVEGKELCPDCTNYLVNQNSCKYCQGCGYERCL